MWAYRFDEEHIENDYLGEPAKYLTKSDFFQARKWFNKTMKKPHRTTVLDDESPYYSFKKGNLWLGGED
jgi:hypothetical protein